jgi:hypothetical protein
VALALAVVVPGGCLWAPDIHEEPPEANGGGPTIERAMVSPSPDRPHQLGGTSTFDVSGAVGHPSLPPEQLQYYWFLNYRTEDDPEDIRPPFAWAQGIQSIPLNPCVEKVKVIYGVVQGGTGADVRRYPLELFVTDGTTGRMEIKPTGRELTGSYAYVAWVLEEPDKTCP